MADLNRTGGVYYAYPVTESRNTPAPKGYQPFYVSHYGRHGSRYLISDNDYKQVADKLHEADRAGALTPLGRDVMQCVDSVIKETHLRAGDLSPLGVRQHRGIAERMYSAIRRYSPMMPSSRPAARSWCAVCFRWMHSASA